MNGVCTVAQNRYPSGFIDVAALSRALIIRTRRPSCPAFVSPANGQSSRLTSVRFRSLRILQGMLRCHSRSATK